MQQDIKHCLLSHLDGNWTALVVLTRTMVDKEWIVNASEASRRLGSFLHSKLEEKVSAKQVNPNIKSNTTVPFFGSVSGS